MKPNKDLIKKYLEGNCSEKEQKEALKLLGEDESMQVLDEMAGEAWEETSYENSTDDLNPEMLYQNIRGELHLDTPGSTQRYPVRPWIYAACISIIALCTFYFIQHKSRSAATSPLQEMVVKSMPAGMKSTIQLSDGSKVILNSGSKISYSKGFTDSSRVIMLEGEAFFEVARDKTRPFSVIAAGTVTTALGTSFNINARHISCKISLATGKVIVTPHDTAPDHSEDTYMLNPGESLKVDNANKTVLKSTFDPHADLLWKDGILYFKETPVKQVIKTLELWYDVEFQIKGNKNIAKKYTGRFENASLTHVLDNMSFVLDFEYLIQGKKIIILHQTK